MTSKTEPETNHRDLSRLDMRPEPSPEPYHLPKGSDWNRHHTVYRAPAFPPHPDDRKG